MKRFISYTTVILAAAVSFASCKDFLEKAPRTSQSTELTLSTIEGLDKATLGAYSYIASVGWYGGVRVLESEMRSGNGMKDLSHNSNRYATEMNWNYTPDATSSQWAYSYITIARANNVIDNLGDKGTEEQRNNLKAECLFIRALSHFDCVTLYAQPYTRDNGASLGVPVVLHTDASGQPERKTVAEVYNQVIDDLTEAEKIIDPDYERSGVADAKAVVSLNAIRALLARVYAYKGDWTNCAAYATKVIESGDYTLYTADNYCDVWNGNVGGSEVIFEIYKDLNNLSDEDCCYMVYPLGSYGDCICSSELYEMYEDGDVRKEMYRDDADVAKGTAATQGLYWTLKYEGKGLMAGTDANNTVVLRLSEMYLLRAEARYNLQQSDAATDDINAIVTNRGLEGYAMVTDTDIRNERRKELAWEGHHFFDMARWGKDIVREDCYSLSKPNISFNGVDEYRWALPVPKREMEVNENLEQNPGY